ncbi:MAG: hypothetical protein DMG33_10675 [Acidobacteria bacterium]|nr:MAG: hypothetical protein DMG33_10675 [Acidobacteriota bacterium]
MSGQMLKLKQASVVLQLDPKELQNLVQFGVVKPKRSEGTHYFNPSTLLVAKVAFYLKESLGTRMSVLSKLMEACMTSVAVSGPKSDSTILALVAHNLLRAARNLAWMTEESRAVRA